LNVCSDTLLSRTAASKLFHTAGTLYAKHRCASATDELVYCSYFGNTELKWVNFFHMNYLKLQRSIENSER